MIEAYVGALITFGTPMHERPAARKARITEIAERYKGYIKGVWMVYQWSELSTDLQIREGLIDVLKHAHTLDLRVSIGIKDRNFGTDRYSVPVPSDVRKLGVQFVDGIHSCRVWESEYIDKQVEWVAKILAPTLADYAETTCQLDSVAWGESSISGPPSFEDYADNLVDLHTRCSKYLNPLGIRSVCQVNWLDGYDQVEKLVMDMPLHVGLSCPDTAPGMFLKNDSDLQLPKVHGLLAMEKTNQSDKRVLEPRMEAWDMRPQDYPEALRLVNGTLNAQAVLIGTPFSSRRHIPANMSTEDTDKIILDALKPFMVECMNAELLITPVPVDDPDDPTPTDCDNALHITEINNFIAEHSQRMTRAYNTVGRITTDMEVLRRIVDNFGTHTEDLEKYLDGLKSSGEES